MSGLVALYRLDGERASPAILEAMMVAQQHRGTDAHGSHIDESIGLGHCLLATTPEDGLVQQPLRDRHVDRWLVADARIDNRADLFAAGLGAARPADQVADAELILEAYDRWGDACVEHLVGDFAFALWDGPRRRLFCARDHLGVRPLYYHRDAHAFRCASEMQTLFADPSVPKRVHRLSVGLFFMDEYNESDQTLYDQIFALPAGHTLVVTRDRLHVSAYWRPDPWKETRLSSPDAYAERFYEVFSEAVRCRLRSSGPVGSHVSGGVDSASVASVAAHLRRQSPGSIPPIELVTLTFPGLSCDEEAFSRTVAERWQLPFHATSALDAPVNDPRGARFPDTYFRPTVLMFALSFELARERGIRTTLTGLGSDQLMHRAELAQIADHLDRGEIGRVLPTFYPGASLPGLGTWLGLAASVFVPSSVRDVIRAVRRPRQEVPPWVPTALARDVSSHLAEAASARARIPYPSRVARHFCEWITLKPDVQLGFAVVDRMAARSGAECRHPFFDVRLVELLLGVPQAERAGTGADPVKPLLRRSMRALLPPEIHDRVDGAEFTPYLERTLLHEQQMAIEDLFQHSRLVAHGLAIPEEVRKVTVARDVNAICAIASMECWLRDLEKVKCEPHVDARHPPEQ